jgi:hypothetical protein
VVVVPLPPLGVSGAVVPFAAIALSMIGLTVFLFARVLPTNGQPPLVTQLLLALAVLGGGSVLLLALVFVFVSSNGTSAWTWVLLAFNFMMMAPAGIWFVGLILFRDRRVRPADWVWPVAFGLATTGSEALMGVLFALAGASTAPAPGPTIALGLASPWFFWSMAAVMAALVLWAPLTGVERAGSLALTVASAFAPWVTTAPLVGGLLMVALMGGVFAGLTRLLLKRPLSLGEVGFLVGLDAAFAAMALAGLAVVAGGGSVPSAIAFGSVMGIAMAGEVTYLVRRFFRAGGGRPWIPRTPDPDELPRPAPATPMPRAERAGSELTTTAR